MLNRQWILAARPRGQLTSDILRLRETKVPALEDGEFLVANLYLSLDPTARIWMSEIEQYLPPVEIGEVMRGSTVGRVISSRCPGYAMGDLVQGFGNWQDYWIGKDRQLSLLKTDPGMPLTLYLGLLGITGYTAYFGMLDIGRPQPGETVVVSAAAGAVGSVAGQLAKIHGARVIGIAGTDEKSAWLTNELGFDAAINHHGSDLLAQLREIAEEGVDVYFDNTGGPILDTMLQHLRIGARIPLCGLIASYNEIGDESGPRHYRNLLMKRATVTGFLVTDFHARFREARAALKGWYQDGRLKQRTQVFQGLENAPELMEKLFDGSHTGKLIVQVAPE